MADSHILPIPQIDDKIVINSEIQRVVKITTWEDTEDDGEDITVLTITLVKKGKEPVIIPESFYNAFREESNEA